MLSRHILLINLNIEAVKKLIYLFLLLIVISPNLVFGQKTDVPLLGVCATMDKVPLVHKHGYTFIQPTVAEILQPQKPDSLYDGPINNIDFPLDMVVCNVFIPGSIKTTGPDVNEQKIIAYATRVFERAEKLNIRLIVFGSGASRMIPDGFDKNVARKQFVDISRKLAVLAAQYDIVLSLESQNKEECNFINTLQEAILIAKKVDHPNFRVTVDTYHMMRENEPADHIIDGGKYIYHCDIGEKETRSAPGVKGDNFVPYFRAFQQIGYKGMIALECRFTDLETELPLAKETIAKQWELAKKL